jgi:hypothetical protein
MVVSHVSNVSNAAWLFAELRAERPGILNWCLVGAKRAREKAANSGDKA